MKKPLLPTLFRTRFRRLLPLLAPVVALVAFGTSPAARAQSAEAGAKKAAMCIGCHNIPDYKASFPEVYRVPMLNGQNAKYIVSSLAQYKKGDRKHPTMRAVAASLSEQDMADLAAFYAGQSKPDAASSNGVAAASAATAPGAVPTRVAELLKKGNCVACHGADFNTPIDPSYPKLAGQHPDYLYVALREYQTDKNPNMGRNNAIMSGMARLLTHEEAKVLSDYIASLPSELKTVTQSRWR